MAAELPATTDIDNTELTLNDSGYCQKALIKVYNHGLYLTQSSSSVAAIVAADETQAIELVVTSRLVTAVNIRDAFDEGIRRSTKNQTDAISSEIASFSSVFANRVEKGDQFSFTYTTEQGTTIMRNGEQQKVIEGIAFKQALFGIWLSANSVDQKLKVKLLG